MKSLHSFGFAFALLGGFASAGCATAMPSQDLLDARALYARANQGPAPGINPADLHTAKQQLDMAEAAFVKEGDSQNSRDQAYLAARKTQLAEVVARTRLSSQTKDGVVSAMHADERKTVALTSAELGRAKTELNTQAAALQNERARREAAEKRAAQAASDLAKFATVKQEPRGMVITLSGGVLFASAKSELLPSAQLKLNDVASALTKEDPSSKMVVEGHTDSQGAAAYNQDLSTRRAQAVRDYLVSRGVASDRITSQGFGPSRSVADNASPEGRANNRRVEIVVVPSASTP
jgi:outer membrane protein OmpA-like peptidoglycan-associated protein